jgi:hypothetical protein
MSYLIQPHEYNKITDKYKVNELKTLCKEYGLRVSGKKNILINRISSHLKNTYYAIIIQKYARRFLSKLYILNACPNRNARLVNDDDFYTLDPFKNLPIWQYMDVVENNFIYRFNIASLLKLFETSQDSCKNPFTNMVFDKNVYQRLKRHIRMSHQLGFPIETTIDYPQIETIESEIINIFMSIDRLGFYTKSEWLISLDRRGLYRFLLELIDIWMYRMSFTDEQRAEICPQSWRTLIRKRDVSWFRHLTLSEMRNTLCSIIRKMISESHDKDKNYIGATMVLMALTLVSYEASKELPWLYQSII